MKIEGFREVNVTRVTRGRASTLAIKGFIKGIYSFITNVSARCNMEQFHEKTALIAGQFILIFESFRRDYQTDLEIQIAHNEGLAQKPVCLFDVLLVSSSSTQYLLLDTQYAPLLSSDQSHLPCPHEPKL